LLLRSIRNIISLFISCISLFLTLPYQVTAKTKPAPADNGNSCGGNVAYSGSGDGFNYVSEPEQTLLYELLVTVSMAMEDRQQQDGFIRSILSPAVAAFTSAEAQAVYADPARFMQMLRLTPDAERMRFQTLNQISIFHSVFRQLLPESANERSHKLVVEAQYNCRIAGSGNAASAGAPRMQRKKDQTAAVAAASAPLHPAIELLFQVGSITFASFNHD
jgi:hypothetical protein